MSQAFHIRPAVAADSEALWPLMRDLAVFEHYIDSFAITPDIVRHCGFEKNPPDFQCLVAEADGGLVGMLVYYLLPYTAQNRPVLYMKELYVAEEARGAGVGEALMQTLAEAARRYGCAQIKWTVAPWNTAGQRFYQRLGAVENRDWLNYEWNV